MQTARPQLSPDGNWWWGGRQWQPISSYPPLPSAEATAEPVARPAAPDLDPQARPSWLPAASARIVLGNAAEPVTAESPLDTPAAKSFTQIPTEGNSVWVQQTYQPSASKPAGLSRYIAGASVVLLLLVAGSAAYLHQRSSSVPPPVVDYAHMSATALMSHGASEIKTAGSYHLHGNAGSLIQDITVAGPKEASVDIKAPDGTISMMLTGGYQFLKAPAVFYADKNPLLATNAADQWLIVPPNESLTPLTSVVNLDKTSQCLLGRTGTLTKVGPAIIDTQSVIEVDDKGEIPGGTPAHFYFLREGGRLMGIDITGCQHAGRYRPNLRWWPRPPDPKLLGGGQAPL